MRKRSHASHRSDSGFTLTELLIVIIILGVLTGIVVFAVGQFTDRGETAACKAAMKTTEVAVETYRANNNGTAPNDLNTLIPDYLRTDPSTTKYTIAYYKNGLAAAPPLPAVPPGGVTGDLVGGDKTYDCSA